VEDVKHQLSLCTAGYREPIMMSDSLPGRISEGEAFLHPRFFEILTLVREKFLSNVLHFTTNASLLDEPFVRRLAQFRPLEINVSLHSAQPRLWTRIFRGTPRQAETALGSLALLRQAGIAFTGTIVPLPRLCGWDDIAATFAFLVAGGAKAVLLWQPGFSQKTPAALRRRIACPAEELEDFLARQRERYPGYPIHPQPNPAEARDVPVKRVIEATLRGNPRTGGGAYRRVLWLASEAAWPQLSRRVAEAAAGIAAEHRVVPVRNRSYGGNIRVSGLLMVPDFLAAGRQALARWPAAELILIPQRAFDSFLRDLQKTPAYLIAEGLGRTTWLVFEDGATRPLKGRGFLAPGPTPRQRCEALAEAFTRAVGEGNYAAAASLVASFPIPTSEGPLQERRFRAFLKRNRGPLAAAGAAPRLFEPLGDGRALCREELPDGSGAETVRWLFLQRNGGAWKVEMLFLGDPQPQFY
jgi:hypothetical protein